MLLNLNLVWKEIVKIIKLKNSVSEYLSLDYAECKLCVTGDWLTLLGHAAYEEKDAHKNL